MKRIILLFLSLGAAQVMAKPSLNSGMVEIRPGVKLYVEHQPAAPGRPTLFLLNGLTYSLRQYAPLVRALLELDPGIGVVTYDMQGMGNTLLQNLSVRNQAIPVELQAQDLHDLVRTLNITGPKSVAGLSYGGAVEAVHALNYSDDFDNYVTIAPMVERLPAQDQVIKNMVIGHKMNPFNALDPRNDDELYDFYLRNWIYAVYPSAEPVILENPWKLEAVFRMVQGVKNWNAFDNAARFPRGKVHLIAAVRDEHVKVERLNDFWNALPESSRASYLRFGRSKHKIPEYYPDELAAWLLHILNDNPHLKRGLTFDGDPIVGEARSGDIRIPLTKAGLCETLLSTTRRAR
jgi:pimeloyl-ACP methyl ester carboxylesterase